MECKIKVLFISLAMGFLFGYLSKADLYASEVEVTPFGTLAETLSYYDCTQDSENPSFSKHDIISEINEGDALRHFPQAKRINNPSSPKANLAFLKRSHILYCPPLIIESYKRFPSGLTEARRYLISLGKLII